MYYDAPIYNDRPIGTLCWFCQRSATTKEQRCSWSDGFEPVSGWDATQTDLHYYSQKECKSFCVYKCPLFLFEDGSGRYETDETSWKFLKYDDGTPVYIKNHNSVIKADVS